MRLKQLPVNKTTKVSTKVQDILDWVDKMGQSHSDKKNSSLGGNIKRKDEKRLFYLGVKRRRTKSPLEEHELETCKNTGLEKLAKKDEEIDASCLNEYVKNSEMLAFFKLFDDNLIQDFLWMDSCAKISDKYLLAMVYAYFKRAELTRREYTRSNFFLALYLANDMEEDDEDQKYDILPWALGHKWRDLYPGFLRKRDKLWKKMNYRAVVSRRTCDEVMSIEPNHPIWKRTRKPHHGGAILEISSSLEDVNLTPRGPDASPLYCKQCEDMEHLDSGSSGYLSSPQSRGVFFKDHAKCIITNKCRMVFKRKSEGCGQNLHSTKTPARKSSTTKTPR